MQKDGKHDWECVFPGGFYYWRCKKCYETAPYPSPSFPKTSCSEVKLVAICEEKLDGR